MEKNTKQHQRDAPLPEPKKEDENRFKNQYQVTHEFYKPFLVEDEAGVVPCKHRQARRKPHAQAAEPHFTSCLLENRIEINQRDRGVNRYEIIDLEHFFIRRKRTSD